MTRIEIKQHNAKVIIQVREFMQIKLNARYRMRIKMGYKELANRLNSAELFSSSGNHWTFRSLYRMMQRNGLTLYQIERHIN